MNDIMTNPTMQALTSHALFGLVLSFGVYLAFHQVHRRFPYPYLNPLLLSIISIIALLTWTDIPYESYQVGGDILTLVIKPATVALAIPLKQNVDVLLKHFKAILVGILLGSLVHGFLVAIMAVLFGYSSELLATLLPKSVTTPIALEVSKSMGGIGSLTIALVIVTGILGPVLAQSIFKWLKITDEVAQGISLGSATHAVGTSKAIQLGEVQGAMSSLAIVVTGIVTVILSPVIFGIVTRLCY